jgi:hypothetical protein
MAEKKDPKRKPPFGERIPEEAFEHARAARAEMRKGFESIFPPEFVAHHRAARREMLLAAREFLNHAIERMETQEKK